LYLHYTSGHIRRAAYSGCLASGRVTSTLPSQDCWGMACLNTGKSPLHSYGRTDWTRVLQGSEAGGSREQCSVRRRRGRQDGGARQDQPRSFSVRRAAQAQRTSGMTVLLFRRVAGGTSQVLCMLRYIEGRCFSESRAPGLLPHYQPRCSFYPARADPGTNSPRGRSTPSRSVVDRTAHDHSTSPEEGRPASSARPTGRDCHLSLLAPPWRRWNPCRACAAMAHLSIAMPGRLTTPQPMIR